MSYDDDPDLWQRDARCTEAGLSRSPQLTLNRIFGDQVPQKRAILEQRRADLQSITDLLSRAADDLRASERRAVAAEERARLAEARAADAQARATNAEARERKINAQAVRAFETMKQRIAHSEAQAAAAETRLDEMAARHAAEIEKAAEARSFALETRLQSAEMRIAAARRALAEGDVAEHAAQGSAQSLFVSPDADIVDTHVRH